MTWYCYFGPFQQDVVYLIRHRKCLWNWARSMKLVTANAANLICKSLHHAALDNWWVECRCSYSFYLYLFPLGYSFGLNECKLFTTCHVLWNGWNQPSCCFFFNNNINTGGQEKTTDASRFYQLKGIAKTTSIHLSCFWPWASIYAFFG